jgi:hypothetical protein
MEEEEKKEGKNTTLRTGMSRRTRNFGRKV